MNKTLEIPKQLFRSGASEFNKDEGVVRLSISSNAPYKRQDWRTGEEYYEVLSHEAGDISLTRLLAGTPLLYNHRRDIQLGRNIQFEVENGKCYVEAKLSKAPDVESYRIKMEEGILVDTSVGYEVLDEGKRVGTKDGIPVYEFKWMPYEASMVTVPADITVGKGRERSKDDTTELKTITILKNEKSPLDGMQGNGDKPAMANEIDAEKLAEDLKTEKQRADSAELALKDAKEAHEKALKEAKEAGEKAVKDAREKAEKDAVASERQRVAGINEYADGVEKAHGFDLSEARKSHIADGKTQQEFEKFVSLTKFCAKPLPTGGNESEGKKSMKMEDFRKLSPLAQRDYCLSGGKLTD